MTLPGIILYTSLSPILSLDGNIPTFFCAISKLDDCPSPFLLMSASLCIEACKSRYYGLPLSQIPPLSSLHITACNSLFHTFNIQYLQMSLVHQMTVGLARCLRSRRLSVLWSISLLRSVTAGTNECSGKISCTTSTMILRRTKRTI